MHVRIEYYNIPVQLPLLFLEKRICSLLRQYVASVRVCVCVCVLT